jgi:hypothetical protein
MWQIMLDECWCDMTWLDTYVDILRVKRIGLNDS